MIEGFDPAKDAANREKHGLFLAFGHRIFADPGFLIVSSVRERDGEERSKVIGAVGGKLHTGVFVWRGGRPRFMSVRGSDGSEERTYRRTEG